MRVIGPALPFALAGGLLLTQGCGGATASQPTLGVPSPPADEGESLRVGTTDPEVLSWRHYPDWAYEPELYEAGEAPRPESAIEAMDRLADVPVPSPPRDVEAALEEECVDPLGDHALCSPRPEVLDRFLIHLEGASNP